MIKLLLDQGLPRTAASFLREHGLDAQHAGDLGLHRIRIEGLKAAAIAELLIRVLGEIGAKLNEGVAVTVSRRSVRVRKLPLSAPPKRS